MNWLQKIAMSVPEALGVLGFSYDESPSIDDIQVRWKQLIFKNHPDRGGDEDFAKRINSAWTVLKSSYTPNHNMYWRDFRDKEPQENGFPEWQTDSRSSRNTVNEQLRRGDINYCKREIYEESLEQGPVEKYTFWAYDGRYLRGSFTAKSNPESFGIAGEIMEEWNSSSYNTEAVLVQKPGAHEVKLIRLQGEDFSGQDYWLSFYSINSNPGNDPEFTRKLNELISNIGN